MKLQDMQKLSSLLNEFVEHSSKLVKRAKFGSSSCHSCLAPRLCGSSFCRSCLAPRLMETIIISKKCLNEVQWEMQRVQLLENDGGCAK